MTELKDAFEQRLQAIFADEACGHLARIDASLAALEQGAPQAPLLLAIEEAVHTLKGAARSIGLAELEYLCHALESLFDALGKSAAALAPAHLARIRPSVALAGLLVEPASGRIRNQALAQIGQLDALARELAASAAVKPS